MHGRCGICAIVLSKDEHSGACILLYGLMIQVKVTAMVQACGRAGLGRISHAYIG